MRTLSLAVILLLVCGRGLEAQSITIQDPAQLYYCVGQSGMITYQASGTGFFPDNQFVLQLSDQTGSFSNYTIAGRDATGAGQIVFQLSSAGSGFRVRVASTHPYVLSNANSTDIVVSSYPAPNLLELSQGRWASLASMVEIAGDTLQISDGISSPNTSHLWQFDQDATIISGNTSSTVQVTYPTGGHKTGSIIASNGVGCSTTKTFGFDLLDCNPVIPIDVHVVTGMEGGSYTSVWVKAGGYFTGVANVVFVEPGGVVDFAGGIYYVRRGASVGKTFGERMTVVADTGVSLTCNCSILRCDSLQFDYSQAGSAAVELPITSSLRFQVGQTHLSISADGDVDLRILNLLGDNILTRHATGDLQLDLADLPSGVYFGIAQAGRERQVRRVLVTH